MDVDLAEHLEDRGDQQPTEAPSLAVSEATPEVLLLMRLVSLAQAQLQSKQTKRIPFPPLPTIRTARAAVRERRRRRHRGRVERLVAEAQARYAAEQAVGAPAADAATWVDPT